MATGLVLTDRIYPNQMPTSVARTTHLFNRCNAEYKPISAEAESVSPV